MYRYLLYSLLVLLGFLLWITLVLVMRRHGKDKRNIAAYLLIGPLHTYLHKRNYSFTKREIIGWGCVFVLMLLAPWITWLLE